LHPHLTPAHNEGIYMTKLLKPCQPQTVLV
jgi:hypothetical protein